jgi:hypothetical protein
VLTLAGQVLQCIVVVEPRLGKRSLMPTHLLVCCCTCGFLFCCADLFLFAVCAILHSQMFLSVTPQLRQHSIDTMQATAISLAQLAPASDLNHIFVDKAGLDVLLDLLTDRSASASESLARHL